MVVRALVLQGPEEHVVVDVELPLRKGTQDVKWVGGCCLGVGGDVHWVELEGR